MVALIKIAFLLLADAAWLVILLFRQTQSVQAENLFLQRQLALFKERGIQPRRIDAGTRISLAILARPFEWRNALFVVQPQTMIRWQRAGWRLFWRCKCRAGRPRSRIFKHKWIMGNVVNVTSRVRAALRYRICVIAKTAETRVYWTVKSPLRDADGSIVGLLGVSTDITERKRAEYLLKESHERLLTVLDSLDAVVYVADMETYELLFVNKFVVDVFGDIVGQPCWKAFQAGQSGPCAFRTNNKLLDAAGNPAEIYHWEFQNTITGRWYDIRDRAIRWVNERIVRLEIAVDVTERKQMDDLVKQLALHDALTKLPNRRLLSDRLSQIMAASARSGCYGALMFLDLDNFKSLNDAHGHAVGDLLLIKVADRLRSCVREMDTVARFGGDEFVVLLFINHEVSLDDILKRADMAMYQAKQAGRNSIRFYDSKPSVMTA
ncbi:MAG: diguanylate cyclase [Gammaproteobacteria bacterium]|nr:diguanylate cyclase [Gammaproteobacteria bacterium]